MLFITFMILLIYLGIIENWFLCLLKMIIFLSQQSFITMNITNYMSVPIFPVFNFKLYEEKLICNRNKKNEMYLFTLFGHQVV